MWLKIFKNITIRKIAKILQINHLSGPRCGISVILLKGMNLID
jgi:hypothetical protein